MCKVAGSSLKGKTTEQLIKEGAEKLNLLKLLTLQKKREVIEKQEIIEESVNQENDQIFNISHSQFQAQEVQSYQMPQQQPQMSNPGLIQANTYNTNVMPQMQNNDNNNQNNFPDFSVVNSNPPVPQQVQNNQYPIQPNTIYSTYNTNNNYLQKSRTMNQCPSYYNQQNPNVYNNNQNYNNSNINYNNNDVPQYPPAEDTDAPKTAWNV